MSLMKVLGIASNGRAFALCVALSVLFSGVAESRAGAEMGEAAPHFALLDQEGRTVDLADLHGRIVVLEWFTLSCPAVEYHHGEAGTMRQVAERYEEDEVVWLAIDSTPDVQAEAHREAVERWEIPYAILRDAEGEVAGAYGARTTPHMFVIDPEGKLAYSGAIDDDPARGGNAEVNYVQQAIEELLADEPVSESETFPYGCRVRTAR